MWTGGPASCGLPHRKLKLESIDIILSSSHAKKFCLLFCLLFLRPKWGWHLNIFVTPSDFRPLPHPFVLYAPWIGGSFMSLGLGQPWPCLDLLPLLPLLFGIAFHLQLVLLSCLDPQAGLEKISGRLSNNCGLNSAKPQISS